MNVIDSYFIFFILLMTSILSFNFSVANKEWMKTYNTPLQIMPQTTRIPTDTSINTFPECTEWRESVIHTSYITRPFTDLYESNKKKTFIHNIMQYVKLCRRLKYKRLLVHLPATPNEMGNLADGMRVLFKIFNKVNDIILVLEIPAFKAGFSMDVKEYFDVIVSNYFKEFTNNNVELCFDTAHLYSNGLDSTDMIKLFETKVNDKKLIDYAKIIHLNGNCMPMGKSDKHTPMFYKNNKMTNTEKLMKYLADKNKILIAENTTTSAEYTDWEKFAKTYNLMLAEFNKNIGT